MVQEGWRHRCSRRAVVRGLHGQSRHRGSVARCGNADRNSCERGRHRSRRHRDCRRWCCKCCACTRACSCTSTSSSARTRTRTRACSCTSARSRTDTGARCCACTRAGSTTCPCASCANDTRDHVEQVVVTGRSSIGQRSRDRGRLARRHRSWRTHHTRRRSRPHRSSRTRWRGPVGSCSCTSARPCASGHAGSRRRTGFDTRSIASSCGTCACTRCPSERRGRGA